MRHDDGSLLVFQCVSVQKRADRFEFVPAAEYVVDTRHGSVGEHILDSAVSLRKPAASSPIHEGAQPGTYVPLRS